MSGAAPARLARRARPPGSVELREEALARWPLRLPGAGRDGVMRRRGAVLERLLHRDGRPVVVRVAQLGPDRVLIGARAGDRAAAAHGIRRLRFALGIDDDLRPFYRRFADDPLLGPSLRARPWLRARRRPEPFEALAWAICEQLVDFDRAVEIERMLVRRLGRRCSHSGLRDAPDAAAVTAAAPALLESCDLAAGRAQAMRRAAREVARGRVDLHAADHERGWRRLRAIPGIGSWTLEMLALHGQGRHDMLPAGDLNLLKLVGRVRAGGDPHARADEPQVREFFAPYGEWAGMAALHLMSWSRPGLVSRADRGARRPTTPARAGTRW